MTQQFDIRHGGFGRAPKFPHASAVDLLLARYRQTGEKHLLAIAETTLEKMARGGVYDQLAGGFHRYSVDEKWLVPHFEKMSYDNSELLRNYVHAATVSARNDLEAPLTDIAQGNGLCGSRGFSTTWYRGVAHHRSFRP